MPESSRPSGSISDLRLHNTIIKIKAAARWPRLVRLSNHRRTRDWPDCNTPRAHFLFLQGCLAISFISFPRVFLKHRPTMSADTLFSVRFVVLVAPTAPHKSTAGRCLCRIAMDLLQVVLVSRSEAPTALSLLQSQEARLPSRNSHLYMRASLRPVRISQ